MTATSSEDVRGILCSFSAALGEPEKERLDSNLSHLGRVGDEMVAGLGGMLTDSFPSVVAIHELYTFSKTDALLLPWGASQYRRGSSQQCSVGQQREGRCRHQQDPGAHRAGTI